MSKKSVASTLKKFDEDPFIIYAAHCDSDPELIYKKAASFWDFDLMKRKPGPAFRENGEYVGTDLDLVTFLHQLVKRNAEIKIPYYKSGTRQSVKEGQMRVKSEGIHGPLTGLTSNKDFLSFSVRINDQSIKNADGSVGESRNYSITNYSGKFSAQWQSIEFMPTKEESDFIKEFMIATGSRIPFKNFVSPARWGNLYSASYFKTKYAVERLELYGKYLNNEIKRLLESGVNYATESDSKSDNYKKSFSESTKNLKSIQVECIQVEVDMPVAETGEYPVTPGTSDDLKRITDLRRNIVYSWIPHLRFMLRATELSFKNLLDKREGEEPIASWIKNAEWERDYKQKGKRIKWNRFIVDQLRVGDIGVSLRYRIHEKSVRVKDDYDF